MELLSKDLKKNMKLLSDILHVDENFDIIYRVITIGGKNACFYCVDGFAKDDTLQRIMQYFLEFKKEDMPNDAHSMSKLLMPYGEVDLKTQVDDIVKNLLSGITILIVEGYDRAICIDCRTYPARSVGEPEKDKVMRGSRDGFVETLVFNTALIRRRIRSPELTMEMFTVGESSKTDVVVSYMKGRVDTEFLEEVTKKIKDIKIDSLTMNQESLAECLYDRSWFNPFPKFKFSERPDTAAASILEGNIIIMVDNSPAAMILPTSIFDIIEEADDYYFPPVTGTYLRLSRLIINIVALMLTPTFLLLMNYPQWLPEWLQFIYFQQDVNVPPLIQFLILEFAIDGLRLAALNTPSMLSTPLSVVAGIVLGDFTVSSGWFNAECMLYMAFVAIANYTQANYELGYALKFLRMLNLIMTQIFGLAGYVAAVIIAVLAVCCNKTISRRSYIYPLIPFDWKNLKNRLIRRRLPGSRE